jgi:hypothetical protein
MFGQRSERFLPAATSASQSNRWSPHETPFNKSLRRPLDEAAKTTTINNKEGLKPKRLMPIDRQTIIFTNLKKGYMSQTQYDVHLFDWRLRLKAKARNCTVLYVLH